MDPTISRQTLLFPLLSPSVNLQSLPPVWAPSLCTRAELSPALLPISWSAGENGREWNGCKCRRLVLAEEWECGGAGQLTSWTPITGSFNPGLGSDTIPDTFWAQTDTALLSCSGQLVWQHWPWFMESFVLVSCFPGTPPLLLKFQSKTWILHKRQQRPGTWRTFCAQVNSVIPYLQGHKVSTAVSTQPCCCQLQSSQDLWISDLFPDENCVSKHNFTQLSKGAFYSDKEITVQSTPQPRRRSALLWPSEIFTSSHIPGAMRMSGRDLYTEEAR